MRPPLLLALLALVMLTSACGGPPGDDRPDTRHRDGEPAPTLPVLNTPTGDPLGRAQCDHALTAWLIRSDADRDGALSRVEFAQDAKAVFTRLDRNGDGFVTPDELQQARMAFLDVPDSQERPQRPRGGGGPGGGGGGGPGGGSQGQDMDSRRGDASGSLDPVMTADNNLDFKVAWSEFANRTDETFAGLDKNADQRLSRDEVLASCPSRPTGPSRR